MWIVAFAPALAVAAEPGPAVLFASGAPLVPSHTAEVDDEGPDEADSDLPSPRGRVRRNSRAELATGRALTITGGTIYAAGWASVALGRDYYDVQKAGYAVTRVGLPVATLGTFVSAGGLEGMGLRPGRTAATAALPFWSAATVMTSPIDHGLTDNVYELTWLGLEVAAVGLTVTQALLNEVHLAEGGREVAVHVDAIVSPGAAQLGVSGTF